MQISEQAVRERAYYIWEGEGRIHGLADLHWQRAEAELTAVAPVKKAAPARKSAAKKVAEVKPAVQAAAPTAPARKAAKPKATAGAVAAAAGKAKPARARTALH